MDEKELGTEKPEELEKPEDLEELEELEELESFESQLDPETLKAMEDALNAVEAERNRVKTDDELLAKYIKDVTLAEKLVEYDDVLQNPPEGVTKERVQEILAHPEASEFFATIKTVKGAKETYYYDGEHMTDHYAVVQASLQDKNILAAIAAAARHDCKIYPRPVKMTAMMDSPYCYTEDEVMGALARMRETEEYQDIGTVTASNGKICIYSSQYMSKKYAQALCEEMEVEWINHL